MVEKIVSAVALNLIAVDKVIRINSDALHVLHYLCLSV
jgi:hypothetical protein